MPKPERRFFGDALELRFAEDDDAAPVIAGYAAVFNSLSEDLGGFREQIAPGAFSKAIGGDVRALFNHDPSMVLGRTRAKTLQLSEDQRGLRVEFTPPETEMGRQVVASLRRGDVDQMSFGFRTLADKWERNADGQEVRTLLEVDLFDVSVVTFPAYQETDVAVRSLDAWRSAQQPPTDLNQLRRRLALADA